jgi:hypothetical protein
MRKESIGSSMMVLQEQSNHQQRLHAIYSRNTPCSPRPPLSATYAYLHSTYSKKQRYDDQQHLRNIRQLVETLNRGKTFAERAKDPHDFFAYPALFFRDVEKTTANLAKKQKKAKKTKSEARLTQEAPKISLEKIRQFLPFLTSFEQSDFE